MTVENASSSLYKLRIMQLVPHWKNLAAPVPQFSSFGRGKQTMFGTQTHTTGCQGLADTDNVAHEPGKIRVNGEVFLVREQHLVKVLTRKRLRVTV